MQQLVAIARWEAYLLVGGLFVVVVYKILTGSISLNGLFTGDRCDGSEFFSPGRVQLLLFTIVTGVNYLMQVAKTPSLQSLPALPHSTLAILAGSHAIYLSGKARNLLLRPLSEYLRMEVLNARNNNSHSK